MMALSDIERVVRALPLAAQQELQQFVDYLQHKYRDENKKQTVRLGGLWQDIEFDVDDEDVRSLRRQVTGRLMKKL
jgi:hypothetical protein